MFIRLFIAAVFSAGILMPAPAEASTGCVTRNEYRAVSPGDSSARVRRVFGARGRLLAAQEIVKDYGTAESPDLHIYGDKVVSYPKCRSFGRGRVGINFDTYTETPATEGRYAVVFTDSKNPRNLIFW